MVSKKEKIAKLRKLTDASISICAKVANEFEDFTDCIKEITKIQLEKGVKNFSELSFCYACYVDEERFVKYCCVTDFVLCNAEVQDFVEEVGKSKNIYYDEDLKSFVTTSHIENLKLLRSKYGEHIAIEQVENLNTGYCMYIHVKFNRKNHFRSAVLLNGKYENGTEICVQALYYNASKLSEILDKNNIRHEDKKIKDLVLPEEQKEANIYKV